MEQDGVKNEGLRGGEKERRNEKRYRYNIFLLYDSSRGGERGRLEDFNRNIVLLEQVRSAGGHMVKQRRFIGNTNNKMINIREYL